MSDERQVCIKLIEEAWPVYLTTIDRNGFPQTRAMFNLRSKERFPKLQPFFSSKGDDFYIIFSTNTSSTKIQDIKSNPNASAYFCLPDEWRGVMIGGTLEIVNDMGVKQAIWHDGWERYYPSGYDDPDHTVLRLHGRMAKGWNQSRTFRVDLGD